MPAQPSTARRRTIVILRLLVAALGLSGIVAQFVVSQINVGVNPFNFFGYFTIQSNIIAVVTLTLAAIFLARREAQPRWLVLARAGMTTYMITTFVVFALLLRGSEIVADFNNPYADDVMHVWVPILVALDWLLVADRPRVAWRDVLWLLIYPAAWGLITVLRGTFIDGFYAYPFLNPALAGGWVPVIIAIIGIAVFIGAVGLLVVWATRLRVVRVDDEATTPAR